MPPSYSSARPDVARLAELAQRADAELVATATQQRSISDVAFDSFAFEPESLLIGETLLERGVNAAAAVIAVASVGWPEMPIGWTVLQSRSGPDHLDLDHTRPVGHDDIDERFAIDADDSSGLARWLHPELRTWLVDCDVRHGPLTMIFDNDVGAGDGTGRGHVSAIYVARIVTDDDGFLATAALVGDVAVQVRSTADG